MFGFLPSPCKHACPRVRGDYKLHFCGLANTLSAEFGPWSRALVNRDATFLFLLTSALAETEPVASLTRCCNPFSRKYQIASACPSSQFAAAVTVSALEHKLLDDQEDEAGLRAFGAGTIRKTLNRSFSHAKGLLAQLGFRAEEVELALKSQKKLEDGNTVSSDNAAEFARPTAAAYASIMSHALTVSHGGVLESGDLSAQESNTLGKRACLIGGSIGSSIGNSLGTLIYFFDASKDYKKDIAKNQFNPLQFENSKQELQPLIRHHSQQLQANVAALPLRRYQGLITSITQTFLHSCNKEFGLQFGNDGNLPGDAETPDGANKQKVPYDGPFYCCGDCCCHGCCAACESCAAPCGAGAQGGVACCEGAGGCCALGACCDGCACA